MMQFVELWDDAANACRQKLIAVWFESKGGKVNGYSVKF